MGRGDRREEEKRILEEEIKNGIEDLNEMAK